MHLYCPHLDPKKNSGEHDIVTGLPLIKYTWLDLVNGEELNAPAFLRLLHVLYVTSVNAVLSGRRGDNAAYRITPSTRPEPQLRGVVDDANYAALVPRGSIEWLHKSAGASVGASRGRVYKWLRGGEHDAEHELSMTALVARCAPRAAAPLIGAYAPRSRRSHVVLVMPRGEPLVLDALSTAERVATLAALTEAVAALHEAGFVHGDIKETNAVWLPGADGARALRLIDWQFALPLLPAARDGDAPATMRWDHRRRGGGTEGYLAPEREDTDAALTAAVDVYALGAVFERHLEHWPHYAAVAADMRAYYAADRPTAATVLARFAAVAAKELRRQRRRAVSGRQRATDKEN